VGRAPPGTRSANSPQTADYVFVSFRGGEQGATTINRETAMGRECRAAASRPDRGESLIPAGACPPRRQRRRLAVLVGPTAGATPRNEIQPRSPRARRDVAGGNRVRRDSSLPHESGTVTINRPPLAPAQPKMVSTKTTEAGHGTGERGGGEIQTSRAGAAAEDWAEEVVCLRRRGLANPFATRRAHPSRAGLASRALRRAHVARDFSCG